MALSPGTRLGPYEIVEPIGAGGMGDVYRAHDTRLGRDIAVKVLPAAFAQDADRLARFEREARAVAALSHPNILAIHDVGTHAGQAYVVTELLDGETLREKLSSSSSARGAPPQLARKAVDIAIQIARGLAAAHDRAIVHRDLKPENVFLLKDGQVKILDFGLARQAPLGSGATETAAGITDPGVVMGTVGYMAPEQVRGQAVDARADVFAFGAVLYEMLTGQRAFKRPTAADTMSAILNDDPPDLNESRTDVSPALSRLVRHCLEKNASERFQAARDIAFSLEALAESGITSGRAGAMPEGPATRPVRLRAWLVLAAFVLGGALAWTLLGTPAPASPGVTRFIVAPPPGQDGIISHVLSRDGRLLIIQVDRLYVRDLAGFFMRPLSSTEGAFSPFLSPDARWVGFVADGKLKKVSTAGGDPLTVCASRSFDLTWGPGDTILFSNGPASGLFTVSADGGEPEVLTTPDARQDERGHRWPDVLPGEKAALFTVWMAGSGVNDARVAVLDLASRKYRVLFRGAHARYLRSGHILYFHAGAWHVVAFDLRTAQVSGEAVTVLDDALGVFPNGGNATELVSVSDSGTIAYKAGSMFGNSELIFVDRAGKIVPTGLPPRRHNTGSKMALSPDGRQVVVTRLEAGAYELWVDDLEKKTETRLAIDGSNVNPVWAPNGRDIAFSSLRKGSADIYRAAIVGGDATPLLADGLDRVPLAWTADSAQLVVTERAPNGSTVLVLTDSAKPTREVLMSANPAGGVALAPDGHWLAYGTGSGELYVQPFPGKRTATRVSSDGAFPRWSAGSKELFYQNQDGDVVALPYEVVDGRFVAGHEKVAFHPLLGTLVGVMPDGLRVLLARQTGPPTVQGARVVLNWFEELKGLTAARPTR